MEYRKLISFGKSSFVVSLPKNWVRQNKLQKGDLIYFDDNGPNLILSKQENKHDDEEKEITIQTDKKSTRQIQREIISAYIRNYKTIILIGEELKNKVEDIQKIIQNLVALEILEQTSKKIVAKDFLNMPETEIKSLIKKMDVTVRSMLSDCKLIFTDDVYTNIKHRDSDVNKLSFLVYRAIRYGLEHPIIIDKKYHMSSNELLSLWWVVFNIENVGDDAKRIARYVQSMEFNPEMKNKFLSILDKLDKNYVQLMNSLYKNDQFLAHAIHETKKETIAQCDDFYKRYHQTMWCGHLVNQLKSLATNIHNIGRSVYQY
ncbi:phosphate uptake regulator PhoU [Candidatus Woesearchaeota archaeon]|nr:phosphate uptake regulator PhoU [Candidatus Woesearchaeota archaeon]